MAGPLGTVWARYKTLILFWGLSFALVVSSLFIQFYESTLADRFVDTKQISISNFRVAITYPRRVLLPVINTPAQTLVFQVTSPENIEYTVRIRGADCFVFYDRDNNPIVPQWDGNGNSVFTAVIRALPTHRSVEQSLRLEFLVNGNTFFVPLESLPSETIIQSQLRIGIGIFARNIALPLGLLSAIAGWVASYLENERKKAESQKEKEKESVHANIREKVEGIPSEFSRDILAGFKYSTALSQSISHHGIEGTIKEKLHSNVLSVMGIATFDRLFSKLGDLANIGDDEHLLLALRIVAAFWKEFSHLSLESDVKQCLKALQKIYSWWRKTDKTLDMLKQALLLWDHYDISSADLVAYVLNKYLPKAAGVEEVSVDKVRTQIEQSAHRKRLIRYQKLDWMLDAYSLTLPDKYQYSDLVQILPIASRAYSDNTYASLFDEERIVAESWVEPVGWNQLTSTSASAQVFTLAIDTPILLHRLWKELTEKQNNPKEGVFPIYWDVSIRSRATLELEEIAYQVAETWIEFLPRNPDAFLDLRSEEREALLGFLGWYVGSWEALLCRLRQRFLWVEDNNRRQKEMSVLLDKMARFNFPYDKGYNPREGQLLDWLSIRPPWLTSTILILVYHESPTLEQQQVLSVFQKNLRKRKVFTKEFFIEDKPMSPNSVITWTDDSLMEILRLRVQRVSNSTFTSFTSLFVRPKDPKPDLLIYDKRLVQESKGSLGRLLELGQRILDHHAQHHPDIPDLLPDDFAVIDES